MKESFFKQFFCLREDIYKDIQKAKTASDKQEFSDKAVECTKLIWTYMMSCKWHNTERSKSLMTVINLKDSQAAERLDISSNTVRSLRSVASSRLFDKLGIDCFDIIRFGDEKKLSLLCYKLRYLIEGYDDVFTFIPRGIVDSAMLEPRESDKKYPFRDCKKELMFLARFDILDMIRTLETLDEDKLAFIIEILMQANVFCGEKEKEAVTIHILRAEEELKRRLGFIE